MVFLQFSHKCYVLKHKHSGLYFLVRYRGMSPFPHKIELTFKIGIFYINRYNLVPTLKIHYIFFFPLLLTQFYIMSIKKITKLVPQTTALFVCDVQERFKGLIWQYPSVISVAGKMASYLTTRHLCVLLIP